MNTRRFSNFSHLIWLAACAVLLLLLVDCQPVKPTTARLPELPTATETSNPSPTATLEPVQPTGTAPESSGEIVLDISGLAQDKTFEILPAVSANAGGPWWEIGPEYRRLSLLGYPVTGNLLKPQIFIYPVNELASANENMGKMAADLNTLLQSRQPSSELPFLPLINELQAVHAQVKFLDFKSGAGIRYLTQFSQGPLPINNLKLVYTFQGVTSDGKYYIAAVLPVTHPELPVTQEISDQQAAELSDYPAYLAKITSWLEQQPTASYIPDLGKLDTLVQSIEMK